MLEESVSCGESVAVVGAEQPAAIRSARQLRCEGCMGGRARSMGRARGAEVRDGEIDVNRRRRGVAIEV